MIRRLLPESVGVPLGSRQLDAVVFGASTGGPRVVETILRALPRDFPAPVAVCQHMPTGFTTLWAQRLDGICKLTVREARMGEKFVPGQVYVAPIGKQMRLLREKDGTNVIVRLTADFSGSTHVPSIDVLMTSAAEAFGSGTLAVLATGLGSDGALGMLAVRRAGGHTVSEAAESAVAYSMPGSAVKLSAVAEEATADEMGPLIVERVNGVF